MWDRITGLDEGPSARRDARPRIVERTSGQGLILPGLHRALHFDIPHPLLQSFRAPSTARWTGAHQCDDGTASTRCVAARVRACGAPVRELRDEFRFAHPSLALISDPIPCCRVSGHRRRRAGREDTNATSSRRRPGAWRPVCVTSCVCLCKLVSCAPPRC